MKFAHVTIKAGNMEESLKFYRDIAGLKVNRRFNAGHNVEIAFLGSETEVELICDNATETIHIGADVSLGFETGSLDETITLLKENNVPVIGEVSQPNPHIKYIFARDPNGLTVQFLQKL